MIVFAVLLDSAQIFADIAIIGFILDSLMSLVGAMFFGIWFSHHDVSLMHPDRALGFLGTVFGEVVPGVDALPFWTIYITIAVVREWTSSEEI